MLGNQGGQSRHSKQATLGETQMLRLVSPLRRAWRWESTAKSASRLCSSAGSSPCTFEGELSTRTLVAFKHEALQRGVSGSLLARFEQQGLKMVALKMLQPTRRLAEAHYQEHRGKCFFERACVMLCAGPVVASVWEGRRVVSAVRAMVGSTEPLDAAVGTIRADYAVHWRRNLVHASSSDEAAAREIALWFRPHEIVRWEQALAPWLYELPGSKTTFD